MFALATNNKDTHQIFNVGIYVRLSREDDETQGHESESIGNQKEYLTRYVMEQGWNLVDIFSDDGYTGTNFNRPDFQRLLKAIESRKVNLVITKDLSRLGRDYIETGHYLERYFPEQKVRYIALNDGIDTFETNNSNNDMSPFKSVMNDFYARDISKKVRSVMNQKRAAGKFIGAFAPYGYLKSPLDNNALVIDPETAPVVREIFERYCQGFGYAQIAYSLNDRGVLPPSSHKALSTNYKTRTKNLSGLWAPDTIRYVLSNPTYAGNMTQRKHATTSYKVKTLMTLPKTSWITVPNTHEGIVSEETFRTVQQLRGVKTYGQDNTPKATHPLGGLLYCQECGARMTFSRTQSGNWYTMCSLYKRFKTCTRHAYKEETLMENVLKDLRRLTEEAEVDQEDLLKDAQEKAKRKPKYIEKATKEIGMAEKRIEEIKRIIKGLYDDKTKGIVTERDYLDLSQGYNKERDTLIHKIERLTKAQKSPQEESKDVLKIVSDLLQFNTVSKIILAKLISRIEITEDKQITIYYKF